MGANSDTKLTFRIDIPLLSGGDEMDERGDNVHLMGIIDGLEKVTAQEFDEYWLIRNWEIILDGGQDGDETLWLCCSSYSISHEMIDTLNMLKGGRNANRYRSRR